MRDQVEVLVIGAGLAGLNCARWLAERGRKVVVLEREDVPGGRVATDVQDGFQLDRGFQVLLEAYPEAGEVLDYSALDLRPFHPGALVWKEGRLNRLGDPLRCPGDLVPTLLSRLATPSDKLRVLKLRLMLWFYGGGTPHRPATTYRYLRQFGFSTRFVESFFRPFLGGVFLEKELSTTSRKFEFLFSMFGRGAAALPAAGMKAIPEQLATRLPPESLRTGVEAVRLNGATVTTAGGEEIRARTVVLAGAAQERALLDIPLPAFHSSYCHYFTTDYPPLNEPILVLNGEPDGPVNNLAVVSRVAPSYAPAGRALISVTCLEESSVERALDQLEGWFGTEVRGWKHLRTYHIAEALPAEPKTNIRPVRLEENLFACGDHRQSSSIQGALASGRRAASAVLHHLMG